MNPKTVRLLCVHGVGHEEADPRFQESWRAAVIDGMKGCNPEVEPAIEFTEYDALFDVDPTPAQVLEALARLGASGLWHGVSDVFRRQRGLETVAERLRWTAGMAVVWAADESLRAAARQRVLDHVERFQPDWILAHSLGSMLCYEAFARPENAARIAGRGFVSFGSQIGSPFVRGILGGHIDPLPVRKWIHLFNPHDDVFTAPLRLEADTFEQVLVDFDIEGVLDHDAVQYLRHARTTEAVWRQAACGPERRGARISRVIRKAVHRRPKQRALLVGINDYPGEADRLQGCVNDVFLMSAVLQECGFAPEDIRVVLDARATTAAILERLEWLLDGAGDGQQRVFYYSGHGAQIPGYGFGEKVDRLDECLVPHDFRWTRENAITDDQFYELYSQLPYGAQFTAILDCCHAGGMTRDGGVRVRGLNPPDDIRHRMLAWNAALEMWQAREIVPVNADAVGWKQKAGLVGASGITRRLGSATALRVLSDADYDRVRRELGHHGPYLPVLLHACQEHEYSYEYRHGVQSHGAFTYALAQTLRSRRRAWAQVVEETAGKLKTLGYNQTPELVCPGKLREAPVPWH